MRSSFEKMVETTGTGQFRPAQLLLCAGFALWGMAAAAATFVSFQEGDLRVGGDRTTVGTNGTVVDAAYNMGAIALRSYYPTSSQDGIQLLSGNNITTTNRALLSFNLSYLTILVGTNFARLDSAALILTHDDAGLGSNVVHALCLTGPFDETTATWNSPHGGGTNAGGIVGATLRERDCPGTNVSPTKALWGSPGWFWTNSGSGPDLLAEAARSAFTNADHTLWLMVKRQSEAANAFFSRFQHDGDPDVNFRPELLVGVDSFQPDSGPLAWYYFNENNNATNSLAAVAAATVADTNRISALNAAAGSGLGPFGPGGTTANTHGFGTGGYVSTPTGFYARANVTAGTEAGAVAGNDYVSFTLGPKPGSTLTLTALSAQFKLQAATTISATLLVRSSTDGFSNNLASLTVLGNGSTNTFVLLTNTLSGPAFTNAINPVEFRFYFFDTTDSTSEFVRMDDVGFFGWATNPSSNVVAVTLTASDPTASESGGDYGAFTLTRSGDTNGTLSVSYTISGTASNGVDYQFLSGNTNFAPGVTNLVLAVIPIDDLQPEPAETVILTLNPSAAYVIAGTNTAAVTIADDNDPSEATVAATGPLAFESPVSMAGTFTISRAQGDTNSSVSVQLAFSGTASNGLDYVASATNSILFGPGVLSRTVAITPVNDSLLEGSETVTLTLLPGAGYTVGAASAATITIFDDESAPTASLLLEAENFANPGGWVVDQQFMDIMGSSYLLAHGLGTPVADARTTAQFPAMGVYRLWVRTKDWTAPLPDHPGSFKVAVDGMEVPMVFGTAGTGWLWQDGGLVLITNLTPEIRLKDQTGFEGRCDALFFAANPAFVPTNEVPALTEWRRAQLGLPAEPPSAGDFDLVVVGGGIAGTAAAIAAARQGLRVALLQDRPWLGGNASQEIRVSTQGTVLNSIVDEINSAPHGNGADQAISDDLTRHQVVQNETNIQLFLQWRAFRANTNNSRITSLDARQTRTGEERRFHAPLFLDSTGDGWIGFWAGALYRAGREARTEFNEPLAPTNSDAMTLGSTLMWRSRDAGHAVAFPAVPWATNVSKDYVVTSADWNWEYGLNRDTIRDAEEIRDHLFQAIYGTFSNAKKNAGNANLELSWVPYVAGKRESRRLVGDYILTEADVRNHPVFPDSVAMGSWSIDLHYTQAGAYDFLTYADQRGVAEYWIPFRCLYSTNVENLMMAGRCLSATHVGLGSPRVMNTCGQMGVATGIAAALCKKHNTTPRGVYQSHAPELRSLLGVAPTSDLPTNTVTILDNSDTNHVEITGAWTASSSVNGYYGYDYLHDGNAGKGAKSVLFRPNVPVDGNYRIYLRWTADANRASSVPIDINARNGTYTLYVDQRWNLGAWYLLGTYSFAAGTNGTIVIRTTGTTGYVIADAVAVAADFSPDPRFSGEPWQDDNADGVCNYVEWLQSQNLLVFASVTAAINGSSVLDCAHAAIAPSTVNFTVQASDYCALSGVPVVTVANSTNTATALPTGEDPPGTHHYTWSVDSTTAPGTWQVSVVGTNELGAAATNSFSLCVSPPLCVVTGRVELERFQGASRTVTFVASGGNVALQTNQLSLAFTSGAAPYSLMVPTNTTLLSAKTAGNLRRRLAVTFAGAQAQVNFLLAAGDIDNSNRVDFDDYLQLLAFWYQANAATDLDGNGLVDIEDYFLLASHWYETGDAP